MSTSFTTVGSGDSYDPTSLAIVNELIGAWSERRQAIGDAAVGDEVAGNDAHDLNAYWKSMQSWIESNCSNYADHTHAISGSFDGLTGDVPIFSLASFRVAAGLNANGFRRATEWNPDPITPDWEADITFSHGQIQAGDICGPWVYEDLQVAFSALKWSREVQGYWDEASHQDPNFAADRRRGIGHASSPCANALISQNNIWNAAGWTPYASIRYWYNASATLEPTGSKWYSQGMRVRGRLAATVATARPVEIDTLFLPGIYTDLDGSYTWQDIDGIGFVNNELHEHETWPQIVPPVANRGGAGEATHIGDYATNPVTVAGMQCGVKTGRYGLTVVKAFLVLKWNFTNSN